MPDTVGSDPIRIRQGEHFNIDLNMYSASASGTDDGGLPYNTTVTSVGVSAYDTDDTYITDLLDGNSAIQTFPVKRRSVVTTPIKYPNINGTGYYKLRWGLDLSNNNRIIVRCNKVVAEL